MRLLKRHLLTVYAIGVFLYLFLPVALVILFGFNDVRGRFNYQWIGFTLEHWESVFFSRTFGGVQGLWDGMLTSLRLAFLSSAIGTVLGTLIALSLGRYSFRGRGATNVFLFLPMATPEVVMGSSILALFLVLGLNQGFLTLLISHIVFIISYVVLTVKARIQGFDRHLEEAAMDLYATEWETFRRVTLPLIMPGVFAAFLLGFALSFDDFIISNFNSGPRVQTLPLWIFGAAQRGIPPEANVLGTVIFVVTVVIMLLNVVWQRRQAARTRV
ncbi:MAG TPA: ABC transporter permease [Acidimicrobiia bacterium]